MGENVSLCCTAWMGIFAYLACVHLHVLLLPIETRYVALKIAFAVMFVHDGMVIACALGGHSKSVFCL